MNRITFRTAVTDLNPKGELCNDSDFLVSLTKMRLTLLVSIYLSDHAIWTQCFLIEKFEPVILGASKVVNLQSQHIKDHTKAVNLKTLGTSQDSVRFIVLFQKSPFAVQIFNNTGELVRATVPLSIYSVYSVLLVDKENNIIICTIQDTNRFVEAGQEPESTDHLYSFNIFSDAGEKLHQWTYRVSAYKSIFHRLFRMPVKQQTSMESLISKSKHFIDASLNSKQELIVLFSSATSSTSLVRAF